MISTAVYSPLLHEQKALSHTLFTGVLLFFPWTFVFALPCLYFGIWIDTEAVAFVQSFLLSLLAVLLAFRLSWVSILHISTATLCVSVITLSSLCMLPFHNLRDLSWLGHPEGAMGIWTWVGYSVLLLSMDMYAGTHKKTLIKNIIFATGALLLLTLAHPYFLGAKDSTWVIGHFTSYLLWPGVACFLLAYGEEERLWKIILTCTGMLAILLSCSKAAWIALGVGLLCLSFFRYFKIIARFRSIPFYWVCSIPILYPMILLLWGRDMRIETLMSRTDSLRIVMADFMEHPLFMITGMGFGQMSDAIIRQTLNIGHKVFQNGVYIPTWEGIGRYDSSSLNQYMDMWMGGGILACLGFWVLHMSPMLSLWKSPSRQGANDIYASSLLFLSMILLFTSASTWFMMIATYPMLIYALGLNTYRFQWDFIHKRQRFLRAIVQGVLILSSCALFYTSIAYYNVGVHFSRDLKSSLSIRIASSAGPITADEVYQNRGPGGIHLAFWMRHYYTKEGHQVDDIVLPALVLIYEHAHMHSLTIAESLKDAVGHFKEGGNIFFPYLSLYFKKYPYRDDLFE